MPYIGTPEGAVEYEREQRQRREAEERAAAKAREELLAEQAEEKELAKYISDPVYASFDFSYIKDFTGAYYSGKNVREEIVKAIRNYHDHFRSQVPETESKKFCTVKE